jgi:hypothetical protein
MTVHNFCMASRSPPYNPGSFPGHALQEFNPPWLPIPCFHYLATPLFSHEGLPFFLLSQSASLQILTLITCTSLALRTISAGCCCCFAKLTAPLTVPDLDPLIKLLCRSGAIIAVSRKLSLSFYLPTLTRSLQSERKLVHARTRPDHALHRLRPPTHGLFLSGSFGLLFGTHSIFEVPRDCTPPNFPLLASLSPYHPPLAPGHGT